jgi:hypothetical protein
MAGQAGHSIARRGSQAAARQGWRLACGDGVGMVFGHRSGIRRLGALAAPFLALSVLVVAGPASAGPVPVRGGSPTATKVPPALERAVRSTLGGRSGAAPAGSRPNTAPSYSQQAKLTASDGAGGDIFGFSVAISAGGTIALIGAQYHNSQTGSAYVFTESGGTWTEAQELTASDAMKGDFFGNAVALSADGTIALVGAYGKNAYSYTGAVYVFTEGDGTWTQTQELTASDGAPGDNFGFYVALSATGTTAVIGADAKDSYTGAAYVFTESGGTWTQAQKLTASDSHTSDIFGSSVALSALGTVALIGAQGKNGNTRRGLRVHGERRQLDRGPGADRARRGAGRRLRLLGGALPRQHHRPHRGAVQEQRGGAAYVFKQGGGTWTQAQELTPSDDGGVFGQSVGLSHDGSVALIGASINNGAMGAAYVFTEPSSRLPYKSSRNR